MHYQHPQPNSMLFGVAVLFTTKFEDINVYLEEPTGLDDVVTKLKAKMDLTKQNLVEDARLEGIDG
jgi:hypothetical protein